MDTEPGYELAVTDNLLFPIAPMLNHLFIIPLPRTSNRLKEKVARKWNSGTKNSFKPDQPLRKQWCKLQTKAGSDVYEIRSSAFDLSVKTLAAFRSQYLSNMRKLPMLPY